VQAAWRSEVRGLVTFLICCLTSNRVSWVQGELEDVTDTGSAIVAVLIRSQVLNQTLWNPSGIAPAIERSVLGYGTPLSYLAPPDGAVSSSARRKAATLTTGFPK
jgi:hypothetical protein